MLRQSPAYVVGQVRASVLRWRWRRVESAHHGMNPRVSGSGPAWSPIKKALKSKDSESWQAKHKGALKSLMANRQWPQQRLYGAGLAEDNHCRLCRGMTGGDQPGTLMHRHVCPALGRFHELHCPNWFRGFLARSGGVLSSTAHLAVTRCLCPSLSVPVRSDELFDTFTWVKTCHWIPAGCIVCTDGSLFDSKLAVGCQSLGWAFAVTNGGGYEASRRHTSCGCDHIPLIVGDRKSPSQRLTPRSQFAIEQGPISADNTARRNPKTSRDPCEGVKELITPHRHRQTGAQASGHRQVCSRRQHAPATR